MALVYMQFNCKTFIRDLTISFQLDKVLKTYNTLSKIPALLSAEITSNGAVLKSIWSQRDVEKGKTTKILRVHSLNTDAKTTQSMCSVDITGQYVGFYIHDKILDINTILQIIELFVENREFNRINSRK